jgi:hypothetical protein
MSASETNVKWKNLISPASLVKRKAAWSFKDFYTGKLIKEFSFTAAAQRTGSEKALK